MSAVKSRVAIHAEAARDASLARAAYQAAQDAADALSYGEHPDAYAAADDEADNLFTVYNAARAAELQAYIAYVDPLGRGREADTVPVYWPGNGSLDPALTLG